MFLDERRQPDLDRYVDIYIDEMKTNWSLPENDGRYQPIRHDVEQCTQAHFGTDEKAIADFKIWDGFSIACLGLNTKSLKLKGDEASMESSNLVFKIGRCNNETRTED